MNVLVSVHDKTGLVEFFRKLPNLRIYATEGTAKFLEKNGIDVRRLSEITGLVESRNLKTLHPEVFRRIYSGFFDVVVVNLYENEIDVGGSAILKAAVKNYERVLPVSNPKRYDEVAERIRMNRVDEDFRLKLVIEALEHVIEHDRRALEKLRRKTKNIQKT